MDFHRNYIYWPACFSHQRLTLPNCPLLLKKLGIFLKHQSNGFSLQLILLKNPKPLDLLYGFTASVLGDVRSHVQTSELTTWHFPSNFNIILSHSLNHYSATSRKPLAQPYLYTSPKDHFCDHFFFFQPVNAITRNCLNFLLKGSCQVTKKDHHRKLRAGNGDPSHTQIYRCVHIHICTGSQNKNHILKIQKLSFSDIKTLHDNKQIVFTCFSPPLNEITYELRVSDII